MKHDTDDEENVHEGDEGTGVGVYPQTANTAGTGCRRPKTSGKVTPVHVISVAPIQPQEEVAVNRTCFQRVKHGITTGFKRYGKFVGRHPFLSVCLPILLFGGLSLGVLRMEEETDMEHIYFPRNSRALDDRKTVRDTFPDRNNVSYNAFSQSDVEESVSLLFQTDGDIFEYNTLYEIGDIVNRVKSVTAVSSGQTQMYSDVCARAASQCVIDGEYVLGKEFQTALKAGSVTYPNWESSLGNIGLFSAIAGVELKSGKLMSATVLKISFKLTSGSKAWQRSFSTLAKDLDPVWTEVTYETPNSLNEEVENSMNDVWLFFLTIVIMLGYAVMVTAGGDPVSSRTMLAFGGVLAAGLGIVGSMGLLCLCGVKYVNIMGVIPFLIIGIGVDDMFLMMSSWSETIPQTDLSVPNRVGATLAGAGIGITITSVTDVLAFAIGTTSVFRSVTSFSLYAGTAVLFCYVSYATLFAGCLTFHGRRVYTSRHFVTCRKTRSRDEFLTEGRSSCFSCCCGGSVPREERADESFCEKLPRLVLPKLILSTPSRIVVLVGFVCYIFASIYGAYQLQQGLIMKKLVIESSYYHRYLNLQEQHFPTRLPVGFIVKGVVDYGGEEGAEFKRILERAKGDPGMNASFERCWLSSYKKSKLDADSPNDFVQNLHKFLNSSDGLEFQPDVVFDSTGKGIEASRCFVLSEPNSDQYAQADLMIRMRELADASSLPVFAYHSAFVVFEQFLAVLPATLQMVGFAVVIMSIVTFTFLPHLPMVLLVTLTIGMILLGIFGFMHFWDISLSSLTMIHLVMSVGFSVDFSAHVCAAYMVSGGTTRTERAYDAITHAAGPVLNGGLSTLLGVLMPVFSESYIFTSFARIMFMVIGFGVLHAILFLPVVLSFIGPQGH